MTRFLCLHLPHLATDRMRCAGDLSPGSEHAALVLTRRSGQTVQVAHACPAAQEAGLRVGMTLGQAQALVPGLLVRDQDASADANCLRQLAEWALRFSPLVEIASPDTLLLDIRGCAGLFRGEGRLARQAVGGLLRQGYHARAAVADTLGAACALAVGTSRTLTVVPAEMQSAYLAPVPAGALRLERRVIEALDVVGVRSVGDLLMLPRAALADRFGPELARRLQQALGEVYEGVTPYLPEPPPTARRAFESPVSDRTTLQQAVGALVEAVLAEVLRKDHALLRLDCVLALERRPPTLLAIGLACPSRQAAHITSLLRQRLEALDPTSEVWAEGVCGVALIARETAPWSATQGELFEGPAPQEGAALGELMDRLASRLGHAALARPMLLADHQPEQAYRYASVAEAGCAPWTVPRTTPPTMPNHAPDDPPPASAKDDWVLPEEPGAPARHDQHGVSTLRPADAERVDALAQAASNGTSANCVAPDEEPRAARAPRPMRLLARPEPLRVLAMVPDGPPTWFSDGRQEYAVARAWGPERIETAWWRGPDVRRDYFRVRCRSGEEFWLFRAGDEQRWYLHGVFA